MLKEELKLSDEIWNVIRKQAYSNVHRDIEKYGKAVDRMQKGYALEMRIFIVDKKKLGLEICR